MSPTRGIRVHSGRAVLALILGLAALPFLTAYGLHAAHWRPAAVASHGTLVEPGPALPLGALRGADGQALGPASLRGRWLMVLALPGGCEASCRARLDEMRRIRVALYRDMSRVARLVLADPGDPVLQAAARAEPDLLVARGAGPWLDLSAADGAEAAPRLYLVDPLGQLVMRYPARPEPAGVKADLERLLKFSWNG
jgi:hypothetical protein